MKNAFSALTRRSFLRQGMQGCVAMSSGMLLSACNSSNDFDTGESVSNIGNIGALSATPDANGLRLPDGFSSRIVATTDIVPVAGSSYPWHGLPDGGATFSMPGGGWVYVSNSELGPGEGGVGALEFSADGELVGSSRQERRQDPGHGEVSYRHR